MSPIILVEKMIVIASISFLLTLLVFIVHTFISAFEGLVIPSATLNDYVECDYEVPLSSEIMEKGILIYPSCDGEEQR